MAAKTGLLLVVAVLVVAVLAYLWYANQQAVPAPAPVVNPAGNVPPGQNKPAPAPAPVPQPAPAPAPLPIFTPPPPQLPPPPPPPAPRADWATIADCGYADNIAGWYDVQKQGACNDYCRTVGPSPPNYPNTWIACVLAGRTDNNVFKPFSPSQIGNRCEASTRAGIGCNPR